MIGFDMDYDLIGNAVLGVGVYILLFTTYIYFFEKTDTVSIEDDVKKLVDAQFGKTSKEDNV